MKVILCVVISDGRHVPDSSVLSTRFSNCARIQEKPNMATKIIPTPITNKITGSKICEVVTDIAKDVLRHTIPNANNHWILDPNQSQLVDTLIVASILNRWFSIADRLASIFFKRSLLISDIVPSYHGIACCTNSSINSPFRTKNVR